MTATDTPPQLERALLEVLGPRLLGAVSEQACDHLLAFLDGCYQPVVAA